jgi:hypothetical protein
VDAGLEYHTELEFLFQLNIKLKKDGKLETDDQIGNGREQVHSGSGCDEEK